MHLCSIPLHHGFSGLVVSMLASGTRVCGFEPGRSHQIFSGIKILSMHSFRMEVNLFAPCRRFSVWKRTRWLHGSWVTGKICRLFLAWFSPSLIEVATLAWHGVPLELMEETKERCTEGQCNTGLGVYGATRPLNQSICLSVCLSVCLSIYLSIYLSTPSQSTDSQHLRRQSSLPHCTHSLLMMGCMWARNM
jgi:hypothetical protein